MTKANPPPTHMVSVTRLIPAGMVPSGTFWDEGGASFRAVVHQHGWRWHPINTKARAQGAPVGDLVPYYPLVGGLPARAP